MKTYKLREITKTIVDGKHGDCIPDEDSGYYFISCKDIHDGMIDYNNARQIEYNSFVEAFKRTALQASDILITNSGTIGRMAFVQKSDMVEKTAFQKSVAVVRPDTSIIDAKYLYYAIQNCIDRMAELSNGSAQKNLLLSTMREFDIAIHTDLPTQHRIASILSAYDDLIENNRRQIKLLEEAAQRLYREWFVELRFPGHEDVKIVDGVPEGWKVMSMNDIAEYVNGYAFKPSDWGSKGKPIIKIKEMGAGVTTDTPRNSGEGILEKYIVTSGDILFSWSATLSAVIWDQEDGLLNQHLFKVVPSGNIAREFVFQSILHTLNEFYNLTTGSTMKHIQRGKLNEVFVNVPDYGIMKKYESVSSPMREEILILRKRMTLLREARDRLIPKMMSGEREV